MRIVFTVKSIFAVQNFGAYLEDRCVTLSGTPMKTQGAHISVLKLSEMLEDFEHRECRPYGHTLVSKLDVARTVQRALEAHEARPALGASYL